MPIRIRSTNLVYFPVPKTACTSIKFALLNHNRHGLADRLPVNRLFRGKAGTVHAIYPSRLYRHWYPLVYKSRKWVCVVRDPLQRFLSAYSNRILFHRELNHKKHRARLVRAGLSLSPNLHEFVDLFDSYFEHCVAVKHHFRPMCDYLGNEPEKFYRVFTMSRLPDFEHMLATEGVPAKLPRLQTGGTKIQVSQLSTPEKNKLLDFYSKDYEIWGRLLDGSQ